MTSKETQMFVLRRAFRMTKEVREKPVEMQKVAILWCIRASRYFARCGWLRASDLLNDLAEQLQEEIASQGNLL
jgi:hypothetical protein